MNESFKQPEGMQKDIPAIRKNDISNAEVQRRFYLSSNARSEFATRFTIIDDALYEFEQHLERSEVWGEPFFFPNLFGIATRKYNNLLEVLPECKVRGTTQDAILFQTAIDHSVRQSNLNKVKNQVIWDAVTVGEGWLYCAPTQFYRNVREDGELTKRLEYVGLSAERVDPRDIIPAFSALNLHDHTGKQYCPYLFRRRIFYFDSFIAQYGDSEVFDQGVINSIEPVAFDMAFSTDTRTMTTQESGHNDQGADYVIVMEYWDQVNDIVRYYANSFSNQFFESPNGIWFKHKQLPFHVYYNYKRADSLEGVSEISLNMPFHQFTEQSLNLQIDNIMLELQPAYIIDGALSFNEEEQELEPGAIFTVRGLSNGKLADHIMPFRVGGVTADVPGVVAAVESLQIAVTGDDFRSLYVNPQQLATQTLTKREALQKRVRGNIIDNTLHSEFYLHSQIASYIKYELAEAYEGPEGETEFMKIKIKGFEVSQGDPGAKVTEVTRSDGKENSYYLNPEISKDFDVDDIEVLPIKLDEEIKRDKMEKLMLFVQQIFEVAQAPNGAEVLQGLDVANLIKQTASNLGLDTTELLPTLSEGEMAEDYINQEYLQISKGVVPEVDTTKYDPMQRYLQTLEYEKGSVFKELSAKAKNAFTQFQNNLLSNVTTQNTQAFNTQEPGRVSPSPIPEQGGGNELPQPPAIDAAAIEGEITG